jgi:hypothetical protein
MYKYFIVYTFGGWYFRGDGNSEITTDSKISSIDMVERMEVELSASSGHKNLIITNYILMVE